MFLKEGSGAGIKGGSSTSFADMMSPEEAARYDGYWKWKKVEGLENMQTELFMMDGAKRMEK